MFWRLAESDAIELYLQVTGMGKYGYARIPANKEEFDAASISKKLADFLRPMLQFIEETLSQGAKLI